MASVGEGEGDGDGDSWMITEEEKGRKGEERGKGEIGEAEGKR